MKNSIKDPNFDPLENVPLTRSSNLRTQKGSTQKEMLRLIFKINSETNELSMIPDNKDLIDMKNSKVFVYLAEEFTDEKRYKEWVDWSEYSPN
jgi:hypothetical protein